MKRWVSAIVCVIGAGASVASAQTTRPATAAVDRPNIVLILADDLGYSDLGSYGSEIRTPHLDALARDGVSFTQFYNQARCCPTRATLMTGRYPHQVGIGAMIDGYHAGIRKAADSPAYQDRLDPASPTMAERLRDAGYRTLMSGKWHLGHRPEEWPVKRGFDRSFVLVGGAMNYWGGDSGDGPRARMAIDDQPFTPPHDGFFATTAFTDRAIEFVEQATKAEDGKPFFLYLAYNAPHWPLHAEEADVKRYEGVYKEGWQAIRAARVKRMIESGLLPKDAEMTPMDRGNARPWDQLPDDRKAEWSRRMEIFAAQVEQMDREIGRLDAALKQLSVDRQTIVIFLSDNGGAAEDPNSGTAGATMGSRDSYRGYARPWASVSNTPFRLHKTTAYEGGISTPMIVRWPGGSQKAGGRVTTPGHVLDLMPSLLEIAGAKRGEDDAYFEGQSLMRSFRGEAGEADRTLFWEHEGKRGVRHGKWKLVALNDASWELYDIDADRIESKDLAQAQPEVVKDLGKRYEAWAQRVGAQPWSELQRRAEAAR